MKAKSKIICRIFGGLGNQLFIYATARRLALVNNAELVLDDKSGFLYDQQFRRHYQLDHFGISCRKASLSERLEPFSRLRRYFMRHSNKLLSLISCQYIVQRGMSFNSDLLNLRFNGTIYLEGYWQSEGYFKDIKQIILRDLKIKAPEDEMSQGIAKQMKICPSVAVHIRFFDDLQGKNLPMEEYYLAAIEYLERIAPGAHYFVFSDRPKIVAENLIFPSGRVTLVGNNEGDQNAFADLWLMTQCQYFIIANSTFSWWGAWLAQANEKVVIAPSIKHLPISQVDAWSFDGLLPIEWVQL